MSSRRLFAILFWLIAAAALAAPHPAEIADAQAEEIALRAVAFVQKGKLAQARPLFERALAIRRKALPADHPHVATTANNLAYVYEQLEEWQKARPLMEEAYEIRLRVLGRDDPTTIVALESLLNILMNSGGEKKAAPLYDEFLAIRKAELGSDHPTVAGHSFLAGMAHRKAGHAERAESLLLETARIYRVHGEPGREMLSKVVAVLVDSYQTSEQPAKAGPWLERGLELAKQMHGEKSIEAAAAARHLSAHLNEFGEHARAAQFQKQSLEILEQLYKPGDPAILSALNFLGIIHDNMGEFAEGERLFRRALALAEKHHGSDSLWTAGSLASLGFVLKAIGDFEQAERYNLRALKIREKKLGPDDEQTIDMLNALVALYVTQNLLDRAEPLALRVLHSREKLGSDSNDTAIAIDNLATIYLTKGLTGKARPLYERALKIWEKRSGPEHPSTAVCLDNLGAALAMEGDYDAADVRFARALKIFERTYGPHHPDTATSLRSQARVRFTRGHLQEATALAVRVRDADREALRTMLSFASEQQRLGYLRQRDHFALLATIGDAQGLADAVVQAKGIVLDSVFEDRRIAAAGDPGAVARLHDLKRQLAELTIAKPRAATPAALDQRTAEKERLLKKLEAIESQMARTVAGLGTARRALDITVRDVQRAIPTASVLIEWIRFQKGWSTGRAYGCLVIPPEGEVKWIPLGDADEIDRQVALYRRAARGEADETVLARVLARLHALIWEPAERALPGGTTTVILSPDSALNFVSFATLRPERGPFVAEKYWVHHVASGRDLLREAIPAVSKLALCFGNPDFTLRSGAPQQKAPRLQNAKAPAFEALKLPPLEGAGKECEKLKVQLEGAGFQAALLLGPDATESALRRAASPHVLHLATHGFFLPETQGGLNPMQRSGLALAGAQPTLNAWARGESKASEDDGVITAEEVGALRLGNTWLVTLSACATGTGEAQSGEGVLGLRRGFAQAGARNLMMTLWPVNDRTTMEIMEDFYRRALASGNAPQALAETQREWLPKLREDKGLLHAVNRAGPFIVSSVGSAAR